MRVRTGFALLAAALGLVAGGCGGGSEERRPEVTRAQYVKRFNAICKPYARRLGKLPAPTSLADAQRLAKQAVPIVREELRRERALPRPPADEKALARFFSLRTQAMRALDSMGAAAKLNDPRVAGFALQTFQLRRAQAQQLAERLGLPCA
jgi:hypothetical protein